MRTQKSSSSLPLAAAISKVLDDDDLLREILIHLIFPTSLVRAALVCRRWLRVASEPAFLRRFLTLHPPRLLGFYVEHARLSLPKFVPMPDTPPELAAAARRASSALDDACASGIPAKSILSFRDGRLLVRLDGPDRRDAVLSPLHPGRDAVVLPPPPPSTATFIDGGTTWLNGYMPGGGVAGTRAARRFRDGNRWFVEVHELRDDGAWHNLTSPPIDLPRMMQVYYPIHMFHVAGTGKIILVAFASTIAALRSSASLVPSYMSTVAFPDVLEYTGPGSSYKVSLVALDQPTPMLHLIYVRDLQIHIWLYNLDSGKWLLQDTICLRKIFVDSGMTTSISQDGLAAASAVKIRALGPGAMSVFIQVDDDVPYVHIKSRVVEKVYSVVTEEDGCLTKLVPFMMIWPMFPESKELSNQME